MISLHFVVEIIDNGIGFFNEPNNKSIKLKSEKKTKSQSESSTNCTC